MMKLKNQANFTFVFSLKTPFQFFDLDRYEWDKTRFHFLLRRLKKFSKYEIVVQAVNNHGEGPLSDIMVGHTKEAGDIVNFPALCGWR